MIMIQIPVIPSSARLVRAVSAGGILLGMVFVFSIQTLPGISCPFRELTGYDCFTCGLTRSFSSFLHGDIVGSLRYHLLGPILCAGMILWGGIWFGEALSGRRIAAHVRATIGQKGIVALALACVIFGGIRLGVELLERLSQ
jgi:hypothetical protein